MASKPLITRKAAAAFLGPLATLIPEPRCELDFTSPFGLLIATQLSAQCTDAKVNEITPILFARYPDVAALAEADITELETILRPTGFFRNKARHAKETARLVMETFGGEVPRTMDELLTLPGVARKTANVVLTVAFGVPSGIAVDTHAFRVTSRWGWHAEKNPGTVEPILMKLVPKDQWILGGRRLVLFGRHHCKAKKPACDGCVVRPLCPVGRPGVVPELIEGTEGSRGSTPAA